MEPVEIDMSRGLLKVERCSTTFLALVMLCSASVAISCAPDRKSTVASPGTEAAARELAVPPPPDDFDRSTTLTVGFLIVDGVYNSELVAPMDVLHHTPFHTDPDPGMRVLTVSPDGDMITTFEGLRIVPDHSFANAPEIDVLVVPSAEHSMDSDLENSEMIEWVSDVGARARFVMSLCDGAFVLAKAGLLEGRALTTFPGDQDRFAEMFPDLDLRRGISFVHDGPMITSEGGAKSYDPAMYLVHHLYGLGVTQGVGGGLLIDWPPAEASGATALVVQ